MSNKIKRVYLSGLISGRNLEETVEEFNRVADGLKAAGYEVDNPASLAPLKMQWTTYMAKADVALDSDGVDVVLMLPGWQESDGAKLEWYWAHIRGIRVYYMEKADREKFGGHSLDWMRKQAGKEDASHQSMWDLLPDYLKARFMGGVKPDDRTKSE